MQKPPPPKKPDGMKLKIHKEGFSGFNATFLFDVAIIALAIVVILSVIASYGN